MKRLIPVILLGLTFGFTASAAPLGTAFTYQSQLTTTNGIPLSGSYDFIFSLYNAQTGPAQVGSSITNLAVPLTNGIFTVTLDFGSAPFNGTSLWMDISVRSNGTGGTFTELLPRQALMPTPYAIYAASSGNLIGTLPATQINGTISDSALSANIPRLNGSASFTGTVSAASGFSGNGASLTNLNASQLTSGTVPSARFSGTYSSPVTINNASDSFSGNGLYIGASHIGGWPNPVVKFENLGGASTNYAPALRVVNDNGTNLDGALSVSANVQPSATGIIAEFGNANVFVVTITNDGTVYATGFVGNGALPWQVISGTAVQAVANKGYLLTSASLATVTLPSSPNVGDIIRVSGGGTGGWKVAQNSGQSILISGASTTVGTTGYLSGDRASAVELQCVDSTHFISMKHEGNVVAN